MTQVTEITAERQLIGGKVVRARGITAKKQVILAEKWSKWSK